MMQTPCLASSSAYALATGSNTPEKTQTSSIDYDNHTKTPDKGYFHNNILGCHPTSRSILQREIVYFPVALVPLTTAQSPNLWVNLLVGIILGKKCTLTSVQQSLRSIAALPAA